MKLLVLSDLHLEFSGFEVPADADFDVAILAGDIAAPGTGAMPWVRGSNALKRALAIVLVPGNHEFFNCVMQHELQAMREAAHASAAPPIHVLDCDQVVVAGVRFLGCTLWTDFELRVDTPDGPASDPARGIEAARRAMVDYRAIAVREPAAGGKAPVRKLTPEDTLAVHQRHRAWLAGALAQPFDGPTVVVTHHGPHRGSLAPRFADDWASTAFINELPGHFFEVPVLWIHGHTHASFDYHVGGCRVVCNPRGYQTERMSAPENAGFDRGCVVRIP